MTLATVREPCWIQRIPILPCGLVNAHAGPLRELTGAPICAHAGDLPHLSRERKEKAPFARGKGGSFFW